VALAIPPSNPISEIVPVVLTQSLNSQLVDFGVTVNILGVTADPNQLETGANLFVQISFPDQNSLNDALLKIRTQLQAQYPGQVITITYASRRKRDFSIIEVDSERTLQIHISSSSVTSRNYASLIIVMWFLFSNFM